MSAGSDEIVRELHIEATPAQVFPYFVDPGKLLAWKAVSADTEHWGLIDVASMMRQLGAGS
jgi:uncharacterized protein YndB with AHSA1/START domain